MKKEKIKLHHGETRNPYSLFLIILCSFILTVFPACGKTASQAESRGAVSPFASFRDIPGVSADEIRAIEALRQAVSQKEHKAFIFGGNLTTETFLMENGEVNGFTALFCEWLSSIFGIRFQPEIYIWNDMLEKFDAGTIDFIGSLTATEERLKTYYMTDTIAERQFKMMRLRGSPALDQIARERPLRYMFLQGSNIANIVASVTDSGIYETIRVRDIDDAYHVLKNGDADAFIGGSVTVDFFTASDVYTEDFFPLIFSPVSMATANPELKPVISIVNKALQNGAMPYLNHLHNQGYETYKKMLFIMHLTEEERAYLQNTSHVPTVFQYFNYPITFFNSYEKKWQGFALDILKEVEKLTGLDFQIVNGENTPWPVLMEMLEDGRAHIVPDLVYSPDRADRFIWPKNTFMTDQYALLSKWSHPNLSLNEISYARVGLIINTAHAELFRSWFPNAPHITEYAGTYDAFLAMDKGEVDVVMAGKSRVTAITNYYEFSDYKANFIFNNSYGSTFGFNRDQAVLCSIVDKAMAALDTAAIVGQWESRTYNYKAKLIEAQRPLLVGATVLSLTILALVWIMFYRSRNEGKHLAKLVAEETSTLSAIFDASLEHIFCKDLKSRYTRMNKSMENHYNVRMADIIGKDDTEALGVPPDVAVQYVSLDKRVFDEKQVIISEEFVRSSSGEMLLFETIKTPLIRDGEVTGLVGMSRDITQRKAAEDEARNASEAKSRFIANMSHEMRTPMNVIVGLTDLMLEETDVSGKIKGMLKKINTAGNTLMGLINDVLDISKIEAGRLELTPVKYDVASLLNDIITLNMIRIEEKPITFKLDINDDLPSSLFGDDLRVKQILNNLLSNAFKYTKEGTVTLGVSYRYEDAPDKAGDDVWVLFYVSDTGIGIREEDISKLFSDYNQVDTKANRKIEGPGLGLSITKKFVEMMNGEISVESEYGKGTTFRICIRQGFVADKPIGTETAENLRGFRYSDRKRGLQEKLVRSDLSYARVLVVDDFPTNLDVAAGMLRKYKMQVDCVTSGQEAVDRIAAGEPAYDAIFMDHMMPGMDGMEATSAIRALGTEYAHNIPIIALTANVVAGNDMMFLDNGFDAYLPKPFNVMSLDSVVKRWIRNKDNKQ
jgi:PAS domain S-box-containing protein